MNKYNVGQNVYWIKYVDDKPEIRQFEVVMIKQTKNGYSYNGSNPGTQYIPESKCFASPGDAMQNAIDALHSLFGEGK